MGKDTKIEWADATWNPWYGCTKVSVGCENCYCEREMKRFGKDFNIVQRSKTLFNDPLSWHESARVLTCSWSDFFHPEADPWREEAWSIIRATPHLTYMVLTKRPELMADRMPEDWEEGWPNVWLGVTVESPSWRGRIGFLRLIPAAVHFLSCEPLLGGLDLDLEHIEWVIAGGESGPNYRVTLFEWVTYIRDQCIENGIPFFFKQWGGKKKDPDGTWGGRILEGKKWDEFPTHG